jgi:hypothetical protein
MAKKQDVSALTGILSELNEITGNEYASITSEGTISDVTEHTDTGTHLLNAQLSGDLFGGVPNSQILTLSGPSGVGKCARGSEKIKIFIKESNFGLNEKVVTYEKLFEMLGYDKNVSDYTEMTPNIDIFVETPTNEKVKVESIIRKAPEKICKITTSRNKTFESSYNHLFQNVNGDSVKACEATEIKTIDGIEQIKQFEDLQVKENTYDISIPNPHWYVGHNGLIHHNTFFCLSIMKTFLQENENGLVIVFDSENAINKSRLEQHDFDMSRISHLPVHNLLDFKQQSVKLINKINTDYKPGEYKFLLILDSLGNLPTIKELNDAEKGSDKADFTRSKEIRSIFRMITPKLSIHNIPFLVTNHSYTSVGCLTEGNKVIIKGPFGIPIKKDISKITVKDKVKTMFGWQNVTGTFKYNNIDKDLYEIDLGNIKIKCTENHKFLVKCNDEFIWKKTLELSDEDEIIQY